MTKQEAIELFDSVQALAQALGITPQAVYQWPEELDARRRDWVTGAAVRLGKLPGHDAPGEQEAV